MRSWLLALLYLAGPGLAWAWYHLGTPPPVDRFEILPRSEVQGFVFNQGVVSQNAVEILATTNLFNGSFSGPGGRINVFAAEWKADTAREMSVVQHTPDICWVGAGYRVVPTELPGQVVIRLGDRDVVFECRAFQGPGGGPLELTLWCTLLGGQFLEEGFRFSANPSTSGANTRLEQAGMSRVRGANLFWRSVTRRLPSNGAKQFVRFSTAADDQPLETLERLRRFAAEWLQVHRLPSP